MRLVFAQILFRSTSTFRCHLKCNNQHYEDKACQLRATLPPPSNEVLAPHHRSYLNCSPASHSLLPLCSIRPQSNKSEPRKKCRGKCRILSSVPAGSALAGILAVMHAALDMKSTLTGKHPHLLYLLASAMRPRMLLTLDEDLMVLPVSVRVGQAVDTVAQVRFKKSSFSASLCSLASLADRLHDTRAKMRRPFKQLVAASSIRHSRLSSSALLHKRFHSS